LKDTVENTEKRRRKAFPKLGTAGASNVGRAFAGSYPKSMYDTEGYVAVVVREFQDDKGTPVLADTLSKFLFLLS
jgi:hypothetical protein